MSGNAEAMADIETEWESLGSDVLEEPTQESQEESEDNNESMDQKTTEENRENNSDSDSEDSNRDNGQSENPDEDPSGQDSREVDHGDKETGSKEEQVETTNKGLDLKEYKDKTISIPVDGKEEEVSVQELVNNYNGKVAWDKRFSELDRERKHYKAEVEEVNSYVNTFKSKLQGEEGALAAMEYLGELTGMAPYTIKEKLVASLTPVIQERSQMSAYELQSQFLKEQNDYLKKQNESEVTLSESRKAQQALQTQISQLQEAHGISESEWDQALSTLVEHPQIDKSRLTPEVVTEFIKEERADNFALSAFNELKVDDSTVDSDAIVTTLREVYLRNPDFTKEDLQEIAKASFKQATKTKAEENLAKKIEKKSPVKPVEKHQPHPQQLTAEQLKELDWDNL